MVESVQWQVVSTLPEYGECPDHILLWNPCDGPHLIWATYAGPVALDKIREGRDVYISWARCPEPEGALRRPL